MRVPKLVTRKRPYTSDKQCNIIMHSFIFYLNYNVCLSASLKERLSKTWQDHQNECALSEDSDQTQHLPSLTGAFRCVLSGYREY